MYKWIIACNLIVIFSDMIYAQDTTKLLPLPASILEWSRSSTRLYTPENLWDYIDGSAELFISYGFSTVQTINYSAEGQPDLVVDIFNMNSAPDAFGVFSCSRYHDNDLYGQGSQLSKGLLIFWMDHYYVSIMGYPETKRSAVALDSLARLIVNLIGTEGPLPPELSLLPRDGLDKESVRYFHHYVWLNSLHFISHDNILDISNQTPAVMAKYDEGSDKAVVLIISYPDPVKAAESLENFRKHFSGGTGETISYKDTVNGWVGSQCLANRLVIVLKASSREQCSSLLDKVNSNIKSSGS